MTSKRLTSKMWKHFILSDCKTRATCKYCSNSLAFTQATMSNLRRHLKSKHSEIEAAERKETPMDLYTVEEVRCEGMKTYEITMRSFEEMQQEEINNPPVREVPDPDWTPEESAEWKMDEVAVNIKEKKERKRSAVWNHFKRTPCNTTGICVHCGKTIKLGTVSNLARHLRQKHPSTPFMLHKISDTKQEDIQKYDEQDFPVIAFNEEEVYTEVVEINVNDMEDPLSIIETKTVESSNNLIHSDIQSCEVNDTNVTQSSQTEFLEDNEDFDINDYIKPYKTAILPKQVDQQLVKMIVKGCHHLKLVEQTSFKNFVKLLNPKYQIPSVNKIAVELIPNCYSEVEKRALCSLRDAEGVCIYLDQWKSKANIYFCVTAHFINSDCKFESIFLSCDVLALTENAESLSERLIKIVNAWGISDKIVAVFTDNSEIVSTAIDICKWCRIPHFLRALGVVMHDSLMTTNPLMWKVTTLIDELTQSPETIASIYETQKALHPGFHPVKLVKRVKTDFTAAFSTAEMLSRLIKLKTAICQVTQNSDGIKLTEHEWTILTKLVEFFNVFKSIKTELMKEDRVIMSKIIFYVRTLKREIQKFKVFKINPGEVIFAITTAETALVEQFKDLENTDLTSNLLLLDPRLKKNVFVDESESATACSVLKKEVCEMVLPDPCDKESEPDPSSLWFNFDSEIKKLNAVKDPIGKGILELENYLQEQLLDRNEDPLLWWKERRAIYPRLFKLAKKYLCVTAKFSLRESISYKSAYMLSQLKNSNLSSLQSEVMFLHHNM